jgi:hypothetical protein
MKCKILEQIIEEREKDIEKLRIERNKLKEEIVGKSKKEPIYTDGYGGKYRKFMKRLSNKMIRQKNKALDALIPDRS